MKKSGMLVNSKNGTKVSIKIGKGSGRGADKEFVILTFSDKPSQGVRDAMKLHRFRYYSVDGTWSAFKTDKAMEFAYSLIKENKPTAQKESPKTSARGSSKSTKKSGEKELTLEARVDALEDKIDKILELLSK